MCYAIPGRLVAINNKIGIVDYFGEKRNALIDLDEANEAKVGDYVYAQGGVIISKISEKEALEILDFWKERFFQLKKVDENLSSENSLAILQKINLNKELTKEEMLSLLKINNKIELKTLFDTANTARQKHNGNACCVHGIIEFSNYCRNNCFYCGIRNSSAVQRYRMSEEEIIETAKNAVELGFKAIVLQSGEDEFYDEEKLTKIVREIRKLGVLIFLSIGKREKDLYKKLFNAGARAVLLRFETSNPLIFKKMRPNAVLEKRIELIKYLKKIGYVVATGFILGLPEETEEDIVDNILFAKSLNADMYSFGPFIPAEDTPLENHKSPSKETVLKAIALTRLVDKESKILVTTALETLDKDTKKQALLVGANSVMINLTPKKYARFYNIYGNKAGISEDENQLKQNIKETIGLLYSLGRAPTDLGLNK